MRYQDAASFRQALEQRIKDQADGDGAKLARIRKRVAFDRLLARLSAAAPNKWLLKGGFALDLRLPAIARSTKDVDIEWRAAGEDPLDILLDVAAHDPGDFFVLTIERTGTPEDRLGGSYRFKVSTSLAGRPFESFVLDVGHREDQEIRSQTFWTDDLLGFAEIEPVAVEVVTLEAQVAEKLHALTRVYDGGRGSTRTKDLVDIVLISTTSSLDATALRREIDVVFETRGTHPVPTAVPTPPSEWTNPYRQLADEVGIPNELARGHQDAANMLDPILKGEVVSGSWKAYVRLWETEVNGSP
ncbi:MAG: hypothetical protein QG596_536 [Actinomycetota bacterium]|jgi:predicted nucleotidyltransferase component of viral defense system|nr:hypothetical protein [Actinomycetota bacterium]